MGRPRLSEKVDEGHKNAPARNRPHSRAHPVHPKPAPVEEEIELVYGTTNIFADFGDPDAERKLMKARLAASIIGALDDQKLTVRKGAKIAGIDAADLQRIRNADVSRFTIDRLLLVAIRLGVTVELKLDGQ
jgi:predicted XRE-type DNA-binding protein